MTDAEDFEPPEAPDELAPDWRAALELLRATARAGLLAEGQRSRVRPDVRQRAAPVHLFVDRALWDEIGQPQHVQLQASGGALRILPATPGEGQRVFTRAQTTIRIDCWRGEIGEVGTGDEAASVVDGAIVIGGVLGEVG